MRGKKKYEKLQKAYDDWMKLEKSGEGYQTGLAVKTALARQNLPKAADRNPEGTTKAQWRCVYYLLFCDRLEHKDARSKDCGMNGKSAKERDDAKRVIMQNAVCAEIKKINENGEVP